MAETLWIVIGTVFAVMFFAFALMFVNQKAAPDAMKIMDVQRNEGPAGSIISWQTDKPSQGTVYYDDAGVNKTISDRNFDTTHRIELPVPTMSFYIEACDVSGKCVISDIN